MYRQLTFLCLIAFFMASLMGCDTGEQYTYVQIEIPQGVMKAKLYNSTPKHRDNFIKLASEGFYDGLLFHRVIPGFMAQGGDPDSRTAGPGATLGLGGPGYEIDAEIAALHLKGALAAARTQNPQKRSSGSQFYIVQGRPVDDAYLDQLEAQRSIKYTPEQRALYKEIGGTPFLDFDYTVFGEVIEGLEIIDALLEVQRDNQDRPIENVPMTVKIIDKPN